MARGAVVQLVSQPGVVPSLRQLSARLATDDSAGRNEEAAEAAELVAGLLAMVGPLPTPASAPALR